MIAPWQRQLLQLQRHFDDAAKEGYFVRVTLASGVGCPTYGNEKARKNAPGEDQLRHEYFEKQADRDQKLQTPGLLDADQIRDMSGKVHKPTGHYHVPWETTRTPAKLWAPAKSYSWCGIWGDAEGVQRFVNLACSAASYIPHPMSGRDEPLFLLDRGKNNRGPADLLSVWVQFLAVWSTSTFARLIVRSQPEHRIAPNKTDLFLASAMTIALVTDRHHELVQRDWKRRFKDLQAVLSYINLPQEDKPKRGRGRDLRAWRQIAMDLRGSCRKDGEEGRIDRKLLLRRIRDHLKSNPVPIASGDELTKQALDSFLDNAAHWVVN